MNTCPVTVGFYLKRNFQCWMFLCGKFSRIHCMGQMSFIPDLWKKSIDPARFTEDLLFFLIHSYEFGLSYIVLCFFAQQRSKSHTIPVKWGCAIDYRSWCSSPSKSSSKKNLGMCKNPENRRLPGLWLFLTLGDGTFAFYYQSFCLKACWLMGHLTFLSGNCF